MVNSIKELRQVHINGKTSARFDDALNLLNRLLSIPMWTEPEAIVREVWIENGGENLGNGLLNYTVYNRRDS
jgi:hypothetical protein